VTRQPNQDELAEGITFDQARALESGFFASTSPWNGLDTAMSGRLGTKHLTVSLSNQLLDLIREK
jgi:hypothetical protein